MRISFKSVNSKKSKSNKKFIESLPDYQALQPSPKIISSSFGANSENITSTSQKESTKISWKSKLLSSIAKSVINLESFSLKKVKSLLLDKTLTINSESTWLLPLSDKNFKKLKRFLWWVKFMLEETQYFVWVLRKTSFLVGVPINMVSCIQVTIINFHHFLLRPEFVLTRMISLCPHHFAHSFWQRKLFPSNKLRNLKLITQIQSKKNLEIK